MTSEQVIYVRNILLNITKDDKVFGIRTVEPLLIRFDNDVIISGRNAFILWEDSKELLWYYDINDKTGTTQDLYSRGQIVYPAILSVIPYDCIQEITIPLRIDSFGQSLAILKQMTAVTGYKEKGVALPLSDDIARAMKQKLFDQLDPSKQDTRLKYEKPKVKPAPNESV